MAENEREKKSLESKNEKKSESCCAVRKIKRQKGNKKGYETDRNTEKERQEEIERLEKERQRERLEGEGIESGRYSKNGKETEKDRKERKDRLRERERREKVSIYP